MSKAIRQNRASVAVTQVSPAGLPDFYRLRVVGDCMSPMAPDGACIVATPTEVPRSGDLVVVWFDPSTVPAGTLCAQLKRLATEIPHFVTFPWTDPEGSEVEPVVELQMLKPRRRFFVPCREIVAIHKCVGTVSLVQ